ncbi:MAG: hypothetical protein AAFS13_05505 [Pseudomonadota bacterium]
MANAKDQDAQNDESLSPTASALFGWVSWKHTPALFFWGLAGLSVLLIGADFLINRHDSVHMAERFGFYGFYGFAAFSIAVLSGWPLGALLRRDENYYGEEDEPSDGGGS